MYECKLCKDKFNNVEDVYGHLEHEHHDQIPKDFSAAQYYYYLKTGKEHGNCVVCKMSTKWNDSTNKYHRFCEMEKCKEKYKDEFKKRMIGKYGKIHLLNEPDQQRKMLANRSISGKYKWSDGTEIPYTGSYELDFLKFLDVFMNFESSDIISPSPHTYYYIYEGEEKFYIPDFFIASLDLEIEIKDGGDNPNNHHKIQGVDKVKEKLKDDVLVSQKSFSYIKIVNKNYDGFFEFLHKLKLQYNGEDTTPEPIFVLGENVNHPLADHLHTSEEDVDLSTDDRIPGQNQALIEEFDDSFVEESLSMIEMFDTSRGIEEFHYEAEEVMEFYNKSTRHAISHAYKYRDRFQIGFTVRNIDNIFKNLLQRAQSTGKFDKLRPQLLNMVERCANVEEVNYLRRDKNAGKILLAKLAKNRPDIAKQCHDHIKWLDTEYTQALNNKAKELRSASVAESFTETATGVYP